MLTATLVSLLDVGGSAPYRAMTFPAYRTLLSMLGTGMGAIAVGAAFDGQPVGLALAERDENTTIAHVRSVFVAPAYRRQGVASELLSALEQELKNRDCTEARAVYMTGTPSELILERLLNRLGYEAPKLRTVVVRVPASAMTTAPWVARGRLPPDFQIVPWATVTHEDRNSIERRQQAEQWIPPELFPSRHDTDFEVRTSIALRHHGEVVGWLITHQLDEHLLRLTCSWVREDLQRVGQFVSLIALVTEMGERAIAAGFRQSTWAAHTHQAAMVRFTRRRVAPYAEHYAETKGTRKCLAP